MDMNKKFIDRNSPWPFDPERVRPVEPLAEWVLGVQLGQAGRPTAMAAVEYRRDPSGQWTIDASKIRREVPRERMSLRFLRRVPSQTRYLDVVAEIEERLASPPFDGRGHVIVNQTGTRTAADRFCVTNLNPISVTITDGETESRQSSLVYLVPRTYLIHQLEAKLETGELQIAHDLPEYKGFERQLQEFRPRNSTAGHFDFATEEDARDDLIIAAALAVWWSGRERVVRRMLRIVGT